MGEGEPERLAQDVTNAPTGSEVEVDGLKNVEVVVAARRVAVGKGDEGVNVLREEEGRWEEKTPDEGPKLMAGRGKREEDGESTSPGGAHLSRGRREEAGKGEIGRMYGGRGGAHVRGVSRAGDRDQIESGHQELGQAWQRPICQRQPEKSGQNGQLGHPASGGVIGGCRL